jgi:hypothetical protein
VIKEGELRPGALQTVEGEDWLEKDGRAGTEKAMRNGDAV